MLVDLGRNDLGRVCDYGSVRVPTFMALEKYSHVMHLVSVVEGKLADDQDRLDALVACFPAGTVSGAPKVRAMQIINDLETTPRGIYAGAVGYLDFAGNLDFCIAIRTIVLEAGQAWVQAGAGIVADSNPSAEYEETRDKARAMIRALELAMAGLYGQNSHRRTRRTRTRTSNVARTVALPDFALGLINGSRHRQLRLVHLQPRSVPGRARRGGDSPPQ